MWSFGGQPVPDFNTLFEQYGLFEFASPRCSTVPFLAYWCDAKGRLEEFSDSVGVSLSNSVQLDFEHKVPVQQGSGKSSCTDLMILSDGIAVAIEGKFTELRYKDVRTWLGQFPSQNRTDVLSGWLDLLGRSVNGDFSIDNFFNLPYQLIHRAASACYAGAKERWLVYQIFDATSENCQLYINDLSNLKSLVGMESGLRFCLVACTLMRSDQYANLEAMWDSGNRDLHKQVVAGLRSGDLLKVQVEKVIIV
jgi:hypothetical protein